MEERQNRAQKLSRKEVSNTFEITKFATDKARGNMPGGLVRKRRSWHYLPTWQNAGPVHVTTNIELW